MPDPTVHLSAPEAAGRPAAADARKSGPVQRFVRRVHRLRTLGLGMGFLCVASVLKLHDEALWLWGLLAVNALAWPHLAFWLATRSRDPVQSEFRHLVLDSMFGGAWIAVMQFNLLPSALFATMLTADKVAVGGGRFAVRNLWMLAAACVATSAVLGFPIAFESPMPVVVACIPLLVVYPLAISVVLHALGTKFAHQNKRLVHLSNTDDLTELGNRRQGFAAAEQALARHRRRGGPATLIMLDVDHLKAINDRFGHSAGDEALRVVGATLRRCTRVTDTAARYAGDEFLIVLPETNLRGARELARRIRERLANARLGQAPGWRCTVSIGAADAGSGTAEVEQWIAQADAALYEAKAAGRDRLVAAPVVDARAANDIGSKPAASDGAAEFPARRPRSTVSA
jgi:diguanylate cyclase